MKSLTLIPLIASVLALSGLARADIYRCGNEYTNRITDAQKGQCKLVEGANVTVVEGFKPPVTKPVAVPQSPVRLASATPPAARVDNAEQKARDSDARLILEAELKKAETRFAELSREYNNGEPEKRGNESRNYQKYLDRVAELKADLSRTESDIAGIRRELGRISGSK
ncbi:MAG: hypothetical protein R3E92_16930 [Burkholderiaceae bacterium]|nr:hypothetical protein [Rhodoferax sp.]